MGLQALLAPAIDRFKAETEERREEFRGLAKSFTRFYAFVAQVVSLSDSEIEKLDAYVTYLLRLLPDREVPGDVEITDDMVRLQAFRLVARDEQYASLAPDAGSPLQPITDFGAKPPAEEEEEALSEIVRAFNDRHGTDFKPEDMRKFEEDGDAVTDDEDMSEMLRNNPRDVVFPLFNQKMFGQLVRRMQRENKLSNIIMTDPIVRDRLTRHLFDRAMRRTTENEARNGVKGARERITHTPAEYDPNEGRRQKSARQKPAHEGAGRALRIAPDHATSKQKDRTATHSIPSGLGGIFRVEILDRRKNESLVRIHMPRTEWHHWKGEFWVSDAALKPLPPSDGQ